MNLVSSGLNRIIVVLSSIWVFYSPTLPTSTWLFPYVAMLLIHYQISHWLKSLSIVLAVGFSISHAHVFVQKLKWSDNLGEHSIITIKIDSYFKTNLHGVSGVATVLAVDETPIPRRFRPKVLVQAQTDLFYIDEVWQVFGTTSPIKGTLNRFGFDAEKYWFSQAVVSKLRIDENRSMRLSTWGSVRADLRTQFERQVSHLEHKGLMLALTFGDRQHIDPNKWQEIVTQGIAHLFAISGLHIGLAYLFGATVLWWCIPWLRLPRSSAMVAGLCASLALAYLSGFSTPTVRALLMLSLFSMFYCVRIKIAPHQLLWLTFYLVLLSEPFSLFSSSLWLSFGAMTVLVTMHHFWQADRWWLSLIKLQLCLGVAMFPLMALLFNGVSLSGLLVNLVAVPWVSLVVMPSLMLALLYETVQLYLGLYWEELPAVLWGIINAQFEWLFALTRWLPNWWWEVPLNTALLIGALCWLPMRRARISVTMTLTLLTFYGDVPRAQDIEVTMFDVGHGLAVYARTPDLHLVYDTGKAWQSSGFADSSILPYLRQRSDDLPFWLFISHDDLDHAGGASVLIEGLEPQLILSPSTILPGSVPCIGGRVFEVGNTRVELLWPRVGVVRAYNPHSCVVKLSFEDDSVLLTGDIVKEVEYLMLQSLSQTQLSTTIASVPHHGSASSSGQRFVDAINPRFALSGNDFDGQWSLPNDAVRRRFESVGSLWFDTGECGAIKLVRRSNAHGTLWELRTLRANQPWFRRLLRGQPEESYRLCYRRLSQ